jgi:hypothetical protein
MEELFNLIQSIYSSKIIIFKLKINISRLYSILQEESSKLNALLSLKISKTDAFKILSTAADKTPADTFLIPSNSPINWINDLEFDAQYAGWPRQLNEVSIFPNSQLIPTVFPPSMARILPLRC